ncbi:UNVERIFIED_CONTAM: hypothetical protein Slati_3560000 [Sesamum latifolium]|uniref:NB-ARC domain-containing protein n=1 Tax=Sesamum latifolium TaxID=2727402 RepID=A0AAW2UPD9_9LAMI
MIDENMYRKSNHVLAQLVLLVYSRQKFLIVMDDVWTKDDRNKLQIALLKSNNDGKILITTHRVEVAQFANRDRLPHHFHLLTQDENLLWLKYETLSSRFDNCSACGLHEDSYTVSVLRKVLKTTWRILFVEVV